MERRDQWSGEEGEAVKLNIWIGYKRGEVVNEAVGRGCHESGDERGIAQVEK